MAQPAGIEGRFWFFFSSSLEIEDSGFRMSNRGVCTFCGLLCGDIDFSAKPSTQTCPKAAAGWLAAQPSSNSNLSSLQSGISISRQQALEGVAKLFSSSRRPLLSGLATDVAGVQQMVDLASRTSAILDHMHGPALQTNLNLLQQTGLITTTLSEVRFRADAIILVGDSVLDRFPRLLERIDRSAESEGPTYFHGVHSQKAKVVQLHRHADLPKKQQVSICALRMIHSSKSWGRYAAKSSVIHAHRFFQRMHLRKLTPSTTKFNSSRILSLNPNTRFGFGQRPIFSDQATT
jgi:hypothetical protein